jgi:hypothetical protein
MLYEISNYNFLLTTPNKGKIQLKNIAIGDIKALSDKYQTRIR